MAKSKKENKPGKPETVGQNVRSSMVLCQTHFFLPAFAFRLLIRISEIGSKGGTLLSSNKEQYMVKGVILSSYSDVLSHRPHFYFDCKVEKNYYGFLKRYLEDLEEKEEKNDKNNSNTYDNIADFIDGL